MKKIYLCQTCAHDLAGACCRPKIEFGIIYDAGSVGFQLSQDCDMCDAIDSGWGLLTCAEWEQFLDVCCELI